MPRHRTYPDKTLLLLIGVLVIGGCMLFASAAFGLIARGQSGMTSVVFDHLVLGVALGIVLLVVAMQIDYRFWRTCAPYLYGAAVLATALVFVPHLGATIAGGRRWIIIAHISFQPSEFLKIACVIMAAAYFSAIRGQIAELKWGLGGLLGILAAPALLLIAQPDIGTLGVVAIAVLAVFLVAGARWRDMIIMVALALVVVGVLALVKPYILDRVVTFLHPSENQQSQGYQIKQSLIAIGSGGFFGRGFGQGVQKFTYLPEPMGDSIFAVAGEELGFIGTVVLVGLYLAFSLRGFWVAARAPDLFGALLSAGIATYLGSEAFINIAAMLGVAPLTGIPLTFVSQGGSAMLMSLASAGILLNISKAASNARRHAA